ncbi:sulfotransferase 1 family member D1-like [Syngnathus acus]|uniref:sulfotransferase 1 family member D1-like n=1 Tax=Syngnathus acus TaxID=161584 RepID=UPI0018863EA7|nr:sulfotransferase 1 family member D1-like [Syngnathus acus]
MSENKKILHRATAVMVKGILLSVDIASNIDAICAFRPDPSDLLIASYPKSGTSWILEIVDLLLHNGDAKICRRAPLSMRVPFLEMSDRLGSQPGLDMLKEMNPPRIIKTHLPFQLIPSGFWENKCKTIYVTRNAKDTVVSFYQFQQMNLSSTDPGSWEGYLQRFIHGGWLYGPWYDHVKGYWEERKKRNILYVFYEDMKENLCREVTRIMRYLDLSLSDDVINRIVDLTTFNNMKDNPMANYTFVPKEIFDTSISSYMRKGEVGDWKNHFTPQQSAEFDKVYETKMKEVNIPFRTEL